MNPGWASGALLGAAVGCGLLLVWSRLPHRNRPTLLDRLAPYVGAPSDERIERILAEQVFTPFPTLERIVRPYLARGAHTLERVLGGGASVRKRLDQAGRDQSLHEFRVQQLLWGAAGGAAAIALSLVMLARGYASSPVLLLVFCVAAATAGVVLCDHRLSAAVRDRERRMLAEFPTVADLLALSVAAGEGPVGALERVARSSRGELTRELHRALADARTGATLVDALDRIAERTSLTPLARFVDGIAVAVERGTPLADVLRAQAADVRDLRKRELMEIGSRKEILMLIPIVFLVLPVTIAFALFPGLIQIGTVVP
ncbi:type II secretion system F family protein [Phytoactinopolyspora halotolerans]|uniref:Type II secretion system F family protein n=1 Tax=Phytoactinopolyspora halotolerans TaxID=1981512 RepID=A0A6L9SDG9_9ACTN|nr:type II secretion system F family protein [Phytoactinopolyspora halotolerans]NEE03306.1 type II secretion system F family protein [Phytoactinopolyspora halotolerans]